MTTTGPLPKLVLAAALALAATSPSQPAPPRFAGPGPTTISAEEAAIHADPANGLRDAVVLVHEVEARDHYGKAGADFGRDLRVHQRIKVLAQDAIPILRVPYNEQIEGVVEWWCRTLRPDGGVVDLPRSAMRIVRDDIDGTALEGRLRDAIPGSVVDLGWTIRQRGFLWGSHGLGVALPWPTRSYRLKWFPTRHGARTVLRSGLDPFPVEVTAVGHDFEAAGRDVPADEALEERGADAMLWLVTNTQPAGEYWAQVSREHDAATTAFLQRDQAIVEAIQALNLPATATLDTKLRAAYAFIEKRVRMGGLGPDAKARAASDPSRLPSGILRTGRAQMADIPRLMVGFARRLGADATILLAWTSRWDLGTTIFNRPDALLVAVRPADDPSAGWLALAPGWGLPYGVVPFPFAGNRALLARKEGAAAVTLPTPTGSSISTIRGTVTVTPDLKEVQLEWTRSGTGQEGLFERRWLQQVEDEHREALLANRCAVVAARKDLIDYYDLRDRGVTEGAFPNLFDRTAAFEMTCKTRLPLKPAPIATSEGEGKLLVPFGPFRDLEVDLGLDPPVRRSLFQLPYPAEHSSILEVRAPEGYVPGEPPGDVHADAPCCGTYARNVTRTENGFRVERKLTLPTMRIAASHASAFKEFARTVEEGDRGRLEFRPKQ